MQSFITRREAAKKKLEKRERDFWTVADPEIDAWMLVPGQTRDVFDIHGFVNRHAEANGALKDSECQP